MVTSLRWWLTDRLLDVLRIVTPGDRKARVWQIVEVPRRLSRTEARELAEQVKNL